MPNHNLRKTEGLQGLDLLKKTAQILRSETGCPWDRKQNFKSLQPYFLEEAYEVLAALKSEDTAEMKEEFGDLLFHLFLFSEIASEEKRFNVDEVADGVARKLIRRHPHVFADGTLEQGDDALVSWEVIKADERLKAASAGEPFKSSLSGLPDELPALLRAQRIQEKASRLGFDWVDINGPADKVKEELGELLAELPAFEGEPHWNLEDPADSPGGQVRQRLEEELGDLLFSLVNFARFLKVSPEVALQNANRRFSRRFAGVEKRAYDAGTPMGTPAAPGLDVLEEYYQQAKKDD